MSFISIIWPILSNSLVLYQYHLAHIEYLTCPLSVSFGPYCVPHLSFISIIWPRPSTSLTLYQYHLAHAEYSFSIHLYKLSNRPHPQQDTSFCVCFTTDSSTFQNIARATPLKAKSKFTFFMGAAIRRRDFTTIGLYQYKVLKGYLTIITGFN